MKATGGRQMALLDRYESRGETGEEQEGKTKERREKIGLLGPFICHWPQINHCEDDVLTSVTSTMGHMFSGHKWNILNE